MSSVRLGWTVVAPLNWAALPFGFCAKVHWNVRKSNSASALPEPSSGAERPFRTCRLDPALATGAVLTAGGFRAVHGMRSEERRVGKEWRARRRADE